MKHNLLMMGSLEFRRTLCKRWRTY